MSGAMSYSSYSTGVQIVLTILNLLIVVVGTSGNIFVLYASRVHGALKIDKVSVIFLESLAVSDVIMSLFVYLPSAITVAANRWILAKGFCYVFKVAIVSATYNETMVIAVMSVYRVWMLRKPPGVRTEIRLMWVYVLAGVLQVVGACVVLLTYFVKSSHQHDRTETCNVSNIIITLDLDIQWLGMLSTTIFVMIPMIVTIATTCRIFCILCGYDAKMGQKLGRRYRYIKLLLFVCVTFFVSCVPLIFASIYSAVSGALPTILDHFVNYFLAINVISNPFIYVMISPHFSGYLNKCAKKVRAMCCIASRRPHEDSTTKEHDSERQSTFRKSEEIVTNQQTSAEC